jgi:hypothetical protein
MKAAGRRAGQRNDDDDKDKDDRLWGGGGQHAAGPIFECGGYKRSCVPALLGRCQAALLEVRTRSFL